MVASRFVGTLFVGAGVFRSLDDQTRQSQAAIDIDLLAYGIAFVRDRLLGRVFVESRAEKRNTLADQFQIGGAR